MGSCWKVGKIALTLPNRTAKQLMTMTTMTTMELKHALNEELKAIESSDELMKSAIRLLRKLRKDTDTKEQRHARQRQEMLEELREAFRWIDEVKAGKIKPKSAKEELEEIKRELEEEMA